MGDVIVMKNGMVFFNESRWCTMAIVYSSDVLKREDKTVKTDTDAAKCNCSAILFYSRLQTDFFKLFELFEIKFRIFFLLKL